MNFKIRKACENDFDSILKLIKDLAIFEKSPEKVRQVYAEDLLGRRSVSHNKDLIADQFKNKTILITGAGGSIGSEICLQILGFPIKKLICLTRSEYSLYKLQEKIAKKHDFKITGHLMQINGICKECHKKEK